MAADAVADETGFAEFGILGPLEVRRSGRAVPLGGPRQRAVLALLLLEANRAVSMDRLAEEIWGGDPPDGWVTTLQTYVFHLRRALEPDRLRGAAGGVLVTRGRSYLLRVDREHLDAALFQDGFIAGRAALEAGRYAEGAGTLRQALDLWRGEVLADLADYAFIQPEAVRLEDLRLGALEARIEADLALGQHDALTAELERLAAGHPLRERLHGQLMLALYRCGRQAEALACYRRVRDLLAGELGIDPGEPLQRLHGAVLAHDPALDWDGGRHAPPEGHRAGSATPRARPPGLRRSAGGRPGYKDMGPEGKGSPGDYLIWVEVLKEAGRQQRDVLLVTADVKEDWWRKTRGERRGPRPELVEEMRQETGVRLFMLRPDSLLVHARQVLHLEVRDESVEDIERVASEQASANLARLPFRPMATSPELEPVEGYEAIVVYLGEPELPYGFNGKWLVEPDEDETRTSENGYDAGLYWGVALTGRGKIAVYSAHVNGRWPGTLEVFDSLDQAESKGVRVIQGIGTLCEVYTVRR